jgi:TrmH family RNA methyltransferase
MFMESEYLKRRCLKRVSVMGNEANGISKELEALIKNKLSIPRLGNQKKRKV